MYFSLEPNHFTEFSVQKQANLGENHARVVESGLYDKVLYFDQVTSFVKTPDKYI